MTRVTSAEPLPVPAAIRAAARNNADWCASVCRTHGIANAYGETAWRSAHRTPPYYPDAVTLRPDAVPTDFLSAIDTASPGCSIKDSFATLDLTAHGFAVLFTAQWVHLPATLPAPATPPTTLHAERVSTAARLRDWQTAWHGGDGVPDVFRPALLDDPSVRVLAFHDDESLRGGAILNRGSGLVGVTNLFAADSNDGPAIWSTAITAAASHFPGLPLTGYEHADDLTHALAGGFAALGPLRVWAHARPDARPDARR